MSYMETRIPLSGTSFRIRVKGRAPAATAKGPDGKLAKGGSGRRKSVEDGMEEHNDSTCL